VNSTMSKPNISMNKKARHADNLFTIKVNENLFNKVSLLYINNPMKLLKFVVALLLSSSLSHAFSQYEAIQPQGIYTSDFNIDNRPRLITYYMPLNWGKKDMYPLVVVLHDANSSAKNTIKSLGDIIDAKADSGDCVVLYPDAVAGHWSSKTDTANAAVDSVNDAGFISIMVDFFIQQYKCDPQRLYVVGMGNGGDMAKLINCYSPNKYAAVASINDQMQILLKL
jgi:polyhydroxybutyrate depolymerase